MLFLQLKISIFQYDINHLLKGYMSDITITNCLGRMHIRPPHHPTTPPPTPLMPRTEQSAVRGLLRLGLV